jgi:hypothetical protein
MIRHSHSAWDLQVWTLCNWQHITTFSHEHSSEGLHSNMNGKKGLIFLSWGCKHMQCTQANAWPPIHNSCHINTSLRATQMQQQCLWWRPDFQRRCTTKMRCYLHESFRQVVRGWYWARATTCFGRLRRFLASACVSICSPEQHCPLFAKASST